MSKSTIATFLVRGKNVRRGRFGTHYIPMGTRGVAIAAALSTPGVLDAGWENDELAFFVVDESLVRLFIEEKGVVVETKSPVLAQQLTAYAATSHFVRDDNVAEKPAPKPDVEPVDAFSVAFRFTSGGNWGQRGLTAIVDEASKPCLQELAALGVVSSTNGVIRGHACQGCKTRVGHDGDGQLVISSNHPAVERILAKYTKVIRELPAVFGFHREFFPPSRAEIDAQMDAAFAEQAIRAANLAAFAQKKAAKAAVVETETPTEPARKGRAKKVAQVAVHA